MFLCYPGEPIYEACVTRVEKFLYRKLLKVSEAAHLEFFSLSYFYDRAVDLALLGMDTNAKLPTLLLASWESTTAPSVKVVKY